MARQGKNHTTTYRILIISIVLVLAYGIFIVAAFLRAKAAVCSTTSPGIDLSIAFKRRSLQAISPSAASPRLESACAAIVQFLVLLWVILACVNLLIAIRAPVCLDQPLPEWDDNLMEQSWRYGASCRIHRVLVALSSLMALAITSLSYFDSIERQQTRRGTGLINCYFTCGKPPKSHAVTPFLSSSRSWSSLGKDSLYLIPERRSSRYEQEHWQRRNSLSSQKAIYPHRYQWYDQRPRYASYSLPPSRYSSTLRSVSERPGMELSDRNSSMSSSQSGKTWATITSTRPSTTSSLPRSRASSNPERGNLRRDKGRESTIMTTAAPNVPPLPTIPPPAWAPTLQHTPLSADPTLRALSTGKSSRPALPHSRSSPDLAVQPLKIKKRESSVPAIQGPTADTKEAAAKQKEKIAMSVSPRKQSALPMPTGPPPPPSQPSQRALNHQTQGVPEPSAAPAIPSRAPGHSATPSTTRAQLHTHASMTPRPAISTTPSSTSTHASYLRRPDPIRYRQYHHHPYANSNSHSSGLGIGTSQSQLPLHNYQHQRVWRHGAQPQGSRNPSMSVYSASSYGTHVTDARTSVMTGGRGSRAYSCAQPLSGSGSGRPGTSGRV
ncbi:hypothetical protein H2200_010950 [Cladophialophora chaetospira]|uniref:Uncharacterized protein n=1 Tax=Cladophialophora chaetospira TaxID=386627 RepID=A0AA39CDY5_9EURO|nr:hypothetical protein H2200_010950 [Cladophialophora chaetospira]